MSFDAHHVTRESHSCQATCLVWVAGHASAYMIRHESAPLRIERPPHPRPTSLPLATPGLFESALGSMCEIGEMLAHESHGQVGAALNKGVKESPVSLGRRVGHPRQRPPFVRRYTGPCLDTGDRSVPGTFSDDGNTIAGRASPTRRARLGRVASRCVLGTRPARMNRLMMPSSGSCC